MRLPCWALRRVRPQPFPVHIRHASVAPVRELEVDLDHVLQLSAALGKDPGQLLKGQRDLLGCFRGIVTCRRILAQHARRHQHPTVHSRVGHGVKMLGRALGVDRPDHSGPTLLMPDRVFQPTQRFNLDRDRPLLLTDQDTLVAARKLVVALARCTEAEQVARTQGEMLAGFRDAALDGEAVVAGVVLREHIIVEPAGDVQVVGIVDLIRRGDPWPHGAMDHHGG